MFFGPTATVCAEGLPLATGTGTGLSRVYGLKEEQ